MSIDVTPMNATEVTEVDQPRPSPDGGVFYHWGPQAWIDMVMSKRMLVDRAGPLVPYTFLPILRLSGDPEQIDRDWEEIKGRREKVRLLDSPRERWRKRYGNFVREVRVGAARAAQALLAGAVREHRRRHVRRAGARELHRLPRDDELDDRTIGQGHAQRRTEAASRAGWQKLMFEMFNPAGFLTGPAEITEYDPGRGEVTMFIPDCAWHVCGAQESLPNPDKLPEEGCLLICKGAFEELFQGEDSGLSIEFEPHLPETSCTARMSWKPQA